LWIGIDGKARIDGLSGDIGIKKAPLSGAGLVWGWMALLDCPRRLQISSRKTDFFI
jgi:hypothetical protein